jgi:hypothetical protein
MYVPSSFSSEEPGSGEGDDNASDGDSDSFFARNSEEVARPRVVVPNTTPPHGVFQRDGSCGVGDAFGEEDDEDEDGWGVGYGARSPHHAGAPRGKDVYGDDDDGDDDDDEGGEGGGGPIEVRRRRQQLSWAVHNVGDEDDDEYEEEEDGHEDGPPPLPPPHSESDDPGGDGETRSPP